MAKNPYSVLGVSESATDNEIRAAYRKLAKQYHPDLNPNDPVAAAKMNEINVAYDQIKTEEKRATYRASENAKTFYQQNGYQQSGYQSTPWQTYYRTGQGYYGGSYTGYERSDGNEPPFGWGSIFEEQQRRRANTAQFRRIRFVYLFLLIMMIFLMARCVLDNVYLACASFLDGPNSSRENTTLNEATDRRMNGDTYEIS